jgi:hypothetical protein
VSSTLAELIPDPYSATSQSEVVEADAETRFVAVLKTETRTRPADERARRRFRLYWSLISTFAGLTRRLTLRAIRAEAETRALSRRPSPEAAGWSLHTV